MNVSVSKVESYIKKTAQCASTACFWRWELGVQKDILNAIRTIGVPVLVTRNVILAAHCAPGYGRYCRNLTTEYC